jgi:hypothetical protein
VPYRLRYRLAWDHGLARAVLGVYARVLQGFYVRGAHRGGVTGGRTGLLTVIQRFGSGVNLNVHFHTLVLDGVFAAVTPDRLQFHAAPPPSDAAVAEVLATIRRRVGRLLARRGLDPDRADLAPPDGLAGVAPIHAQLLSASVQGHVALGRHAGTRVGRLGQRPSPPPARRGHRARRTWTASTCTPTSACPRTIAPGWNTSAATCSGPRWSRIASGSARMDGWLSL